MAPAPQFHWYLVLRLDAVQARTPQGVRAKSLLASPCICALTSAQPQTHTRRLRTHLREPPLGATGDYTNTQGGTAHFRATSRELAGWSPDTRSTCTAVRAFAPISGRMPFFIAQKNHLSDEKVVELRGFEPLTPSMPWKCSSQLSYSPKKSWCARQDLNLRPPGPQPDALSGLSYGRTRETKRLRTTRRRQA